MSTPPRDTPPSGPGVAPPDGYEADTSSMGARSRTITNEAEDANGEVKDLQPTKVAAADFGKVHGEYQADYAKGIEQLGTGAVAMCTTITSFAGQIGGAGQDYAASDSGNTGTVNESGAGM